MKRALCLLGVLLFIEGCSLALSDFTYGAGDSGLDAATRPEDAGIDASIDAGVDAGCSSDCSGECVDLANDSRHCGRCDRMCVAPTNAVAVCEAGECGFTCEPGFELVLGMCVERVAPRPLAPLSTSSATSLRPTLRWELAPRSDGARVEICADRGCSTIIDTIDASGTSVRPDVDLPPGVVFWRLYALAGGSAGVSTSATWQLRIPARSADGDVDSAFGCDLDIDGDGLSDIAIGATGINSGDGAVFVFRGGVFGIESTPTVTLGGPVGTGQRFGSAIACAGDLNGDGFTELVVGAPLGSGLVHVYSGGPGGLGTTPQVLDDPAGSGSMNQNFGLSIAGPGDIDGDGYGDLVVGAAGASGAPGRVYVYRGGPAGLGIVPVILNGDSGDRLGIAVAAAGDVNGDGFADFAIGASGAASDDGRIDIYLGRSGGMSSTPQSLLGPAGLHWRLGTELAFAGDVNGDGLSDLVAGSRYVSDFDGTALVYLGSELGLSPAFVRLTNPRGGQRSEFGVSVAGAEDVNGDGYADVIVGARAASSDSGEVYVFQGGSPLGTAATTTLAGPTQGGFGTAVAGAGDTDGDGFAEVVVGAPEINLFDGEVRVFRGAGSGLGTVPQTLPGPTGANGGFGITLNR